VIEVSEYGCIRLGQLVHLNQLTYAPTNTTERLRHYVRVNGAITEANEMFDVGLTGRVIKLEEVSSGCWAHVQHPMGGTRKLHIDTRGQDRGNFGSLRVINDCYQAKLI
jgi:hypothetical protein